MDFPSSWLRDPSLGEKIASEIRLRIVRGQIKPGTTLSENQLASEFGTSRAPVRDGLKALSIEGLIRLDRKGAFVLGLTSKDVKELYDIRFLIENYTLQCLAQADNRKVTETLHRIVDKMEMAERHNDAVEFAYQDLTFHETIIGEADHTRIFHLWNSIRSLVLTALLVATEKRFADRKHEVPQLIEKHRLLISALESNDGDYIEKVIREHFADTRETVQSSLKPL
ncbi:GntR family transcriptional regulator [Cohnella candidum]|uniref:GntR family transcriptional regulator n=1 Tax=Cohnella candidum TaxID=2674991 RepID=A0A3G3JT56_9BACL|nr:GntR family transcriptional regulator [Cohnella candidum]AYQ71410.1 GntR family transcriptional regulator [Cohnella candidum]